MTALVFNEECQYKDCNEIANIRIFYKPTIEGEQPIDPIHLCSEHYEAKSERTGRKFFQTNVERTEVLVTQ